MNLFKKILVPFDGSAPSRAGLDSAIALGKNQHARLRLLHVVDEHAVIQSMEPTLNVGDLLDGLVEGGHQLLAQAAATAKKNGVEADTVLYELHLGRVADRIVDEAEKWHADVIVMGTHGRRGIGRMVMGSDAETVVRATPVPVLLVKGGARKQR